MRAPESGLVHGHFRRLAGAALIAAVIAGCTGGAGSAPPLAATTGPTSASSISVPSAAPSPRPTGTPLPAARLNETLVLADGRKIAAKCYGNGSPTILLEAGGGASLDEWPLQFVLDLAGTTTTCLYSRAGGRGSDPPAVSPPTMKSVTSDAFEVLDLVKAKADVRGPYVLVGWSLGGSVVLAEALTRPKDVVGVAVLDTDFPVDFLRLCEASGRPKSQCQAEYDGDIDAKLMESQIGHAVKPLDIPAVVVTAMDYPGCVDSPSATQSSENAGVILTAKDCASLASAIADKMITDWRVAFPRITQTRVDADHDHLPDAGRSQIVPLILAIVAQARAAT